MTHPLTDHIIESELATPTHFVSGSLVGLFTHDDIRNAADWQLEQVIQFLEDDFHGVFWRDNFMTKFKKAMRPQEDWFEAGTPGRFRREDNQ